VLRLQCSQVSPADRWEDYLKPLILAFTLAFTAAPALAETIAPADARKHVDQTVTVEGQVSDVHTTGSGTIFLDIGGRYPDNAFAAVIFADDAGQFPDTDKFSGKTVDITGVVRLYKGKPEIILKSVDQIKAK
jgi:DNA/RNA endonuclease YhcR with UshA esterase domain